MSSELHRLYRPKKLSDVIGQPDAIKMIESWKKKDRFPHTVLLSGPSGCGKTTLARIIARMVGTEKIDLQENDCANLNSVEDIRALRDKKGLSPIAGKTRSIILDEVHAFRKEAQNVMLKMLEEPPSHLYFFLCTTEPGKLMNTIRTRCTQINIRLLTDDEVTDLAKNICKTEKVKLSDKVISKIVEIANGSARKAVVTLHSIISLDNEKEQLACLNKSAESEKSAFDIAKALFKRNGMSELGPMLKSIEETPETIRRVILSYASSIILNSNGKAGICPFAHAVIEEFREPFFDESSGKPLLIAGIYRLTNKK